MIIDLGSKYNDNKILLLYNIFDLIYVYIMLMFM